MNHGLPKRPWVHPSSESDSQSYERGGEVATVLHFRNQHLSFLLLPPSHLRQSGFIYFAQEILKTLCVLRNIDDLKCAPCPGH